MPHFLLYYFFLYIQVLFLFWPFLHWYKHFSFTLPCPSSHFYWFNPPEGQFHVYLIPLPSSPNITPGTLSMPTYSSVSMGYHLDYITLTSHNLITFNPSWMSPNLNNPCLKGLKPSTLYPSMISTNFSLHVSSCFSITLTISPVQYETGRISEIIALTGTYPNIQQ